MELRSPADTGVSIDVAMPIATLLDHPRALKTLLLAASVLALGYQIQESTPNVHGGLAPWQLRRVQLITLATLGQHLPVSRFAEACNISPGHFARAFKRSTGELPHLWSVHLRVAIAKDLAYRSSININDIAIACGFVDQSHLNKWFKRRTGVSLSAWQREP